MSPSEKRVQELHRAHPVRCLSRGLWRLAYASSLAYASPPHAFSHTDDPSGDGGGYPACSHPHPSQPLAVVGPPSSPDTTSTAISAAFHQPPEPPAHIAPAASASSAAANRSRAGESLGVDPDSETLSQKIERHLHKKCPFSGAVEFAAYVLERISPSAAAAEPQTPSLRLAAARVQPHRRPRRRRRRPGLPPSPPVPAASRGRAPVVARPRSKIGPVQPAPRPRPRRLRHLRSGRRFSPWLSGRRGRFARRLTNEAPARVARRRRRGGGFGGGGGAGSGQSWKAPAAAAAAASASAGEDAHKAHPGRVGPAGVGVGDCRTSLHLLLPLAGRQADTDGRPASGGSSGGRGGEDRGAEMAAKAAATGRRQEAPAEAVRSAAAGGAKANARSCSVPSVRQPCDECRGAAAAHNSCASVLRQCSSELLPQQQPQPVHWKPLLPAGTAPWLLQLAGELALAGSAFTCPRMQPERPSTPTK